MYYNPGVTENVTPGVIFVVKNIRVITKTKENVDYSVLA